MDRRNFIKAGATLTGSLILPFPVKPVQDPVKIAILGTGWWGTDILLTNALASGLFEIIGLCDVNSVSLNRAAAVVTDAGGKKPKLFADYREMYQMAGLQAVVIATPTHWHALHFIDACKAGLHVFLEKPVSYDIREGLAMLDAHRSAGNVVQVDFPRTMLGTNEQIRNLIKSGEIGKIWQVQANIHSNEGGVVEKAVPETIDFETFCGPAPRVPYMCYENGQNPAWRNQHDFSRGIMADWGIHYLNNIRKVLDLGLPSSVAAVGGIARNLGQENPDHLDVRFEFGGLPVYWSHKSWGYTAPVPEHNIGVYYYGEKATVFVGDLGWEIFPAGGKEKIVHGDVRFDMFNPKNLPFYNKAFFDMFSEFVEGIRQKSNKGITNTLADAYKTTASVIYGDMSYRLKSNLNIDPSNMDIINHAEGRKLLKRGYRGPYRHPYAG
jgi:predicted dehydrogenase